MAFDDGPAFEEPAQPNGQDFTVSWTGLVSRTFTLWLRKIGKYLLIAAIPLIFLYAIEALVFYIYFGASISSFYTAISSDPLTLLVNIFVFAFDPVLVTALIALLVISAIISTLVAGAIYKFGLDNYGAPDRGDVGASFHFAIGRIVPLIVVQFVITLISSVLTLSGLYLSAIALVSSDRYYFPLD